MVSLVVLPGLDGTGQLFEDFVSALGKDIEVIVVSYPPDKLLDYAELETVARSCLPADKPFFILGESFSGPIAVSIAASSPRGLQGVILCCSFARNPHPELAWLRPFIRLVPIAFIPLSLLAYFLLGRFANERLRTRLGRILATVSSSVLRHRARTALSIDKTGALSRIMVPMLYLRASDDRVIPKSASQLILSLKPDTRVVEFQAPHFLLQTFPSETASVVKAFVSVETKRRNNCAFLVRTYFEAGLKRL